MNDRITRLSDFPGKQPLFQVRKLVWYVFAIFQTLLVLRLILKLFEVDPIEGFTNVIYSITGFIVYSFTTVFGLGTSGGGVFDWTTVLAIISYWILVIAINRLLTLGKPPLSKIERARVLSIEKYSHQNRRSLTYLILIKKIN